MSQETLTNALNHVAVYLDAKKQQITIFAIGGVVNTLFLENRMHTRDVDFFNDDLTAQETAYILRATKSAMKRNRALEPEWLNNHIVLFIPAETRTILTAQAFAQDETVYTSAGLRLIAAP
ncbi:hypothetical protein N7481_002545 [Penicillium waksmanii]|uniref:uncharacterized protein n=1 Tax=Penicillium waksmanii TaxID=69791 RepID=UPI00254949E3|nr:uncharacterized protein N7481_002545 [Penicillium waksmanii]KAJ5995568.1 hypothetical protein N7481_002545 [Penicillium waksmanii]